MKPVVSVVVLTYNQEQYIAQALDSILNQERNFSIEVLVNDDCSSDKTAEIVKQYQQKYPDVIKAYLQPVNSGAMKSYYNMLKLCRGKYFMNLAGDDYWLPGKMKLQFEFMEKNPDVGMCFGKGKVLKNGKFITNWGTKAGENFNELLLAYQIPPLTVCVRKSVLDTYIKLIQPEKKDWKMEDLPMALWFSRYSKIHFLNQDLGVYRILINSLSRPHEIYERLAFFESAKEVLLYFAGDDKEYVKQVKTAHERTKANIYLAFNNIEKFREHNSKGGTRGFLKNIISYMPGGLFFMKKLIFSTVFVCDLD